MPNAKAPTAKMRVRKAKIPEVEYVPKKRAALETKSLASAQKTATRKRPSIAQLKVLPASNERPTETLDVFVFGNGEGGELGLGVKIKKKRDPTMARYPIRNDILDASTVGVVQVAVGGMHSVALTRDGNVFTWGVNDNKALGRETKWEEPPGGNPDDIADLNPLESTPSAIPLDSFGTGSIRIVQVSACDSATFALTDDGRVYGWGSFRGSDGLCGFLYDSIEDTTRPRYDELLQPTPTLIPGLADVRELSCGANHVLVLTHSGNVYAWGSGEQSELGRRLISRRRFHTLIPHRVGLPKNQIERVYAGFHHNFAIDRLGKVYTWGLNNFGQAGIPATYNELTVASPAIVKSLEPFRIRHIAGGSHHSIACTENGQVLAWGRCDDDQMGLSIDDIPRDHLTFDSAQRPRILNVPTIVPGINNVAFVAAGIDNSMAISDEGKLYAWGFSSEYRTGLGTDESVKVPTLVNGGNLAGKVVSYVGSRGQFSIAAGPSATK